jgi:hypothetical protein
MLRFASNRDHCFPALEASFMRTVPKALTTINLPFNGSIVMTPRICSIQLNHPYPVPETNP